MKILQASNATDKFCHLINDSMSLGSVERRLALANVQIPADYRSVALYDFQCGNPVGGVSSRSDSHRLSALDVAIAMRLARASSVRPSLSGDADGGILKVVVDVDHDALAKKALRP